MKKLVLSLTMLLAITTLTAQEGLGLSVLQNLDNDKVNVLVEAKVTANNLNVGFAGEFKASSNVKRFNASLGYVIALKPVSVVPSIIVGASVEDQDYNKFYGGDLDANLQITKDIALTGKLRYVSSGDGQFNLDNFTPRYFAGLKITL